MIALALSSGCAGLAGPTPTQESVTPVAVPETATPLAPGVPAPTAGTQSDRRIDTDRLRRADDRLRATQSYRLDRVVTIEGANGTVRIERDRRIHADGAAVESLSAESTGEFSLTIRASSLYTDGSAYWTRTTLSNGRVIVNRRHPGPPEMHRLGPTLSEYLFDAAKYRLHDSDSDTIVLRSTGAVTFERPLVPVVLDEPENGTVRLTVTRDGLVRQLSLTYDATFGGAPVTVSIDQRVTEVGTTTVSRPDWVDEP